METSKQTIEINVDAKLTPETSEQLQKVLADLAVVLKKVENETQCQQSIVHNSVTVTRTTTEQAPPQYTSEFVRRQYEREAAVERKIDEILTRLKETRERLSLARHRHLIIVSAACAVVAILATLGTGYFTSDHFIPMYLISRAVFFGIAAYGVTYHGQLWSLGDKQKQAKKR